MSSAIEEARKRRLAKQEEEKLKEEQKNNFSFGDPTEWMGLETGKEKVFRIVGNPFETPDRKPTDAKIILFSEWLNDEGKFTKINWPFIEDGDKFKPDPDWVLTRLYDAINAGGWEQYTEEDINEKAGIVKKNDEIVNKWGRSVYWKNIHIDKQCFQRIKDDNNRRKSDKYPRRVYPTARVILNVIDRHDDWCKENKKTKVLSSGVKPYTFKNDKGEQQTVTFIDRGVPFMVYQKLWDDILSYRDHWNIVDVIITKKEKDYLVRDAFEEKISEESKKIASTQPLTEEELTYELWDLDDRFGPFSYNAMKKNFLKLFKLADLELNKTFEEELNDLAADEAKKINEQKEKEDIKKVQSFVETEIKEDNIQEEKVEEVKEVNKIEERPARQERQERQKREEKVDKISDITQLPYWGNLDNLDVEDVNKFMENFDGETITWKSDTKILMCNCGKPLPATVCNCPYCGEKYETA